MAAITTFNQRQLNDTNPYFPGDYSVRSMKIDDLEIKNIQVQIDLFESIFSSVVTGSVVIVDNENLLSSLPILGGETIRLELESRGSTSEIVKEFYVTKVTDVKKLSMTSLVYTIHFVSKAGVESELRRVSKSYMNVRVEDAVSDIFETQFSDAVLSYYQSSNTQCVVLPNWTAMYACSWLASRAASDRFDTSPYMFFENMDSHYLIPMDMLHSDDTNVEVAQCVIDPIKITASETEQLSVVHDPRMTKDNFQFESYEIIKTTDAMENIVNGLYNNTANTLNLMERTWYSQEFSYLDNYSDSEHLNARHGQNHPFVKTNSPLLDDTNPYRRIIAYHPGLFSQSTQTNLDYDSFTHTKVSKFQQIENFKIRATMPGHLGLRAGHKLYFEPPALQSANVLKQWKNDTRYSGQYIVDSIRHVFMPDKYHQVLEMYRDSLSVSADEKTGNI